MGKSEHHVCALDTAGKRVHDKALPNDETALRTVFTALDRARRARSGADGGRSTGLDRRAGRRGRPQPGYRRSPPS
ncbi:transposase [Pseudonocardia sp. ICBG1142]|uniref:IS110 family transposase n=1 Tax=Pseudonocardia sp. ICBG1142 TaxID=2846760 RepID=UPI0035A97CD5